MYRIKPLYFIPILLLVFNACTESSRSPKPEKYSSSSVAQTHLQGKCMGTIYNIKYQSDSKENFQAAIDQLLLDIENEVSTYIDTSTISKINKPVKSFPLSGDIYPSSSTETKDLHFRRNYKIALDVFNETDGYFDPTVMPLVNYWGFGYTGKKTLTKVDSNKVSELLPLIGFQNFEVIFADGEYVLFKKDKDIKLDFSACAKGYGVDEVCNFLNEKGIKDFYVDIGGEVRAQGTNPHKRPWSIGINTPKENAGLGDFETIVGLKNKAMATSGNYRNYYEIEGVKYAHTINPKTGFPEKNTLLSATILADKCIIADAYATASMVMGVDKAMELIEKLDKIEAFLIYSDEKGEMKTKFTKGFSEILSR